MDGPDKGRIEALAERQESSIRKSYIRTAKALVKHVGSLPNGYDRLGAAIIQAANSDGALLAKLVDACIVIHARHRAIEQEWLERFLGGFGQEEDL